MSREQTAQVRENIGALVAVGIYAWHGWGYVIGYLAIMNGLALVLAVMTRKLERERAGWR